MQIRNALLLGLELGKIRISLPVSLSALAAFILHDGHFSSYAIWLAVGVLLMSCASATINHIQEKDIDKKMPRTIKRPLPSGRVSLLLAWVYAGFFSIIGSVILLAAFTWPVLLLTWITLFWYNLVYTPLKRITAFAVVPGSVTGALPPVIGWVAAGGYILDVQVWLVSAFFFIGQIPHFWLLLLIFGDQYAKAGLPSLSKLFSAGQIKRLSFAWIVATMGAAIIVAWYVLTSHFINIILICYILYMAGALANLFFMQKDFKPMPVFFRVNLLYLLMMFAIMAEGLLRN